MKAAIALLMGLLAVQSTSAFISTFYNYPPASPTCPTWMDLKYSRAILPFCFPLQNFPNGYPYRTPPYCGCFDYVDGCHKAYDVPCVPPILPHPSGVGYVVIPPCDYRQRYVVVY